MAAEIIPFADEPDETPLLDPAGYSGVGLLYGDCAHHALSAWCMLRLARLTLARGDIGEAALAIACLDGQAHLARPPVATFLRRELVGLHGALAVERSLAADRRAAAPERIVL